jgi:hypothetical protein
MRRVLLTTSILLLGGSACLAQVSTMGSTAMGLPTTPGAIVTSPLNGPSPFSATTQTGAPDTTLAPVPLASDPTTPGTVVTCSTPTGQIAPGTPAVPVTSMSAMGGTMGSLPSAAAIPTISAVPAASSPSATGNGIAPYLTLSAQPATSFMTDIPGTTIPAPPLPTTPALPPPSIAVPYVPPPSTMSSAVSPSMMGGAPAMPASTTTMSSRALGTIPTPFVGSTTGTIPSAPPVGGASTIVCSSTPGGPPTNGAALPLSTPDVPASPPPGAIQPDVTQLVTTSLEQTAPVMPTPNTSACVESMSMDLANPATMAPANATGATATPGVSPPPGC